MEETNKSVILLDTAESQGTTKIIRNVNIYGSNVKDVALVWYDNSVAVIDVSENVLKLLMWFSFSFLQLFFSIHFNIVVRN